MTTTPDPATEPRHPIAVVADRTGLSQDVLRIWERRYGAVSPQRGPGGQRLYSDADIARLRLLSLATRAGRAIRQVARLEASALERLVVEDTASRATRPGEGESVALALRWTIALDAVALDTHLRRSIARLGLAAFADRVALPFLRQVGDEWHAGVLSIAQEHLATGVLHAVLADALRAASGARRTAGNPVVVATPAGERHSLGALLVAALAAADGVDVIYLGADLPAQDIAAAAASTGARAVALSLVYVEDRERLLGELAALRAALPASTRIIAGGAAAAPLASALRALGIETGEPASLLRSVATG